MHNEDLEGGSYVSILAGKVIPHRQGRCGRGGARVGGARVGLGVGARVGLGVGLGWGCGARGGAGRCRNREMWSQLYCGN